MTGDAWSDVWKTAPVVALVLALLWAGSKGMWYWGTNARAVMKQLERERDDWRKLARALLKEKGIETNGDDPPPSTKH